MHQKKKYLKYMKHLNTCPKDDNIIKQPIEKVRKLNNISDVVQFFTSFVQACDKKLPKLSEYAYYFVVLYFVLFSFLCTTEMNYLLNHYYNNQICLYKIQ